ncbi:Uncharacterised protein [Mycoplasmopsis californica]|uniref:Lipoprotein n=1 Tax=Mycoplasmopsis equigenitalium TaxID=114883 RepID=A0ABY5J1M8_9BACT|nr:hypothetical protein [Mycoplasmopsis equigenitalium]UUD37153.1 hypothetical protein NPA09_01090 [Mycoplasmopsis equigenitalium]VEU69541.1 Uncharacterised protein [Mycoplasmopsis californica]
MKKMKYLLFPLTLISFSLPLFAISCGKGELSEAEKKEQDEVAKRAIKTEKPIEDAKNALVGLEKTLDAQIDANKSVAEIKTAIEAKLDALKAPFLSAFIANWYFTDILHSEKHKPLDEEKKTFEIEHDKFVKEQKDKLNAIIADTNTDDAKKKELLLAYNNNIRENSGFNANQHSLINALNSLQGLHDIIERYKKENTTP